MIQNCNDPLVEILVDAFLSWPLPDSVRSDPCATIRGYQHRIGTHLLTAIEAREMFVYVLDKLVDEAIGKEMRSFAKAIEDSRYCDSTHCKQCHGGYSPIFLRRGLCFNCTLAELDRLRATIGKWEE